ncbi:MAG: DUF1738 domain-containing protein [Mesorhizobium sp.]|nr:MAG: DUF1738 domain-containing protein [Mesorhizobium sp.]
MQPKAFCQCKAGAKEKRGRTGASLYQEIAARIIAELERGTCHVSSRGSGRRQTLACRGIRHRLHPSGILILWGAVIERSYSSQNWLTFRQTLSLGGNDRKGERGTTIGHADRFVPKDEIERAKAEGDEPHAVPYLQALYRPQCRAVRRPARAPPSRRRATARARKKPFEYRPVRRGHAQSARTVLTRSFAMMLITDNLRARLLANGAAAVETDHRRREAVQSDRAATISRRAFRCRARHGSSSCSEDRLGPPEQHRTRSVGEPPHRQRRTYGLTLHSTMAA